MSLCIDDIIAWCSANRLLLNTDKCEFLCCSFPRKKSAIPSHPLRIGQRFLTPTSTCYLGVIFDYELSFKAHVTKVVSTCFGILRQIRSVRRNLSRPLLINVIESLVLSRLDFCVAVLYGIPRKLSDRLQYVLRASARLVFGISRFCSVSPQLQDLGWLPAEARIQQRLIVLATLAFMEDRRPISPTNFKVPQPCPGAPDSALLQLGTLLFQKSDVRPGEAALSQYLHHVHGTRCHHT